MGVKRVKRKKFIREGGLPCPMELAYVAGLFFLALGTALMQKGDLGMSMVVAPAYILHLKISQGLPWFTFGVAEYSLQACLILLLSLIIRRFRLHYLFSFVTAVLYGFCLDACVGLLSGVKAENLILRILIYILGDVVCCLGVAFMFHTYLAPEAYELIVKEISEVYHKHLSRVKTVYDCTSCAIAVALSFIFFGFGVFRGVGVGTIVTAFFNGMLIMGLGNLLEYFFTFRRIFKYRKNP